MNDAGAPKDSTFTTCGITREVIHDIRVANRSIGCSTSVSRVIAHTIRTTGFGPRRNRLSRRHPVAPPAPKVRAIKGAAIVVAYIPPQGTAKSVFGTAYRSDPRPCATIASRATIHLRRPPSNRPSCGGSGVRSASERDAVRVGVLPASGEARCPIA